MTKQRTGLGRSASRHNLNRITIDKLYKPESILNEPLDYSNSCAICGGQCPTTCKVCLTCAIFGPEVK